MDEKDTNLNQEKEPAVEEKPAERMFTQAEVDEIIGKRLAKERAKHEQEVATKVSEAERLAK